ncbi:hypothetical protein OC835_002490 [Tilletia horrida]|nr:hypothetical protein OC835_002490 [Tilletia horrida]
MSASASNQGTSQGGSQAARARDSFDLVKRLGDVVLKKQTVKRAEVSKQIDQLLDRLRADSNALCEAETRQAAQMHAAHVQTMKELDTELREQIRHLLECYGIIKARDADPDFFYRRYPSWITQDNMATANATVLAAGGDSATLGGGKDELGLELAELAQRAEALSEAAAKIVKEGGVEYEDIRE